MENNCACAFPQEVADLSESEQFEVDYVNRRYAIAIKGYFSREVSYSWLTNITAGLLNIILDGGHVHCVVFAQHLFFL